MENFKGETHGLQIYSGQPYEDFLMVKAWLQMVETGDVSQVMRPDRTSLADFLNTIKEPRIVVYGVDSDKEVDYLFIIEIASDLKDENTVITSIWIAPKSRATRIVARRTFLIHRQIFTRFKNCFSVTWQHGKLSVFKKYGYTVVGLIPELYNVKNVLSLFLTKNDFEKSKAYQLMGGN